MGKLYGNENYEQITDAECTNEFGDDTSEVINNVKLSPQQEKQVSCDISVGLITCLFNKNLFTQEQMKKLITLQKERTRAIK